MASAAGGMEIEEVAAKDPDAIIKEHIIPGMGLQAYQARKIAFKLGLDAKYISRRGEVHDGAGARGGRHRRIAGRNQSLHHHD